MADIALQKPVAGQSITLTPQSDDRLVFDFDSTEAALSREGNNLVISFDDGSSVNLTGFYEAYTSENMPTFLIEGAEVDGESFFAAFDEELMPAAGTSNNAQGSGSGVDTISGTLYDGVDRLNGLDQSYPHKGFEQSATDSPDIPEGTASDSTIITTVSDSDSAKQDVSVTTNQADALSFDDTGFTVGEAGLSDGTGTNESGSTTNASTTIAKNDWLGEENTAPEGSYDITIDDKVIGNATIDKDGNITITLTDATNHGADGSTTDTSTGAQVTVTVVDKLGNSHNVTLDVAIEDDAPKIENFTELDSVTEGGFVTGTLDVDFGADGKGNNAFSVEGSTFEDGKGWVVDGGHVNFDGNGEFTFTAAPDVPTGTVAEFTIVATDADGDSAKQDVSVTINQADAPSLDDTGFTVGEAGLSDGTGTNESGSTIDASTTIAKNDWLGEENTAPEGAYDITIDDKVIGNATVDKDGNITITLTEATNHGADGSTTDTSTGAQVTVTVVDKLGNSHNVTLDVAIEDDAPKIENFTELDSVTEGGFVTGTLDVDFGADGKGNNAFSVEGSTFEDGKGWVVDGGHVNFDGNGEFTFTAAPDVPTGTVAEFTIVATDADGDSAKQDVSVTINQEGAPTIDDSAFVVGEAGLSHGTGTNEDGTNTGSTITVNKADWLGENNTAPEGTYEVKVGEQVVGNATVNKDGSITVELKDNVEHNSSIDGSFQDLASTGRVTVTVHDEAGKPHDVTLDVKIKDDAPETEKSLNTSTESDVATTLVRIDFGADDGEGKSITFDDGSTFTFEGGEWKGSDGGTVSFSEPDASGKVTTTLTGADGTELSNYADPDSSEPNPVWTAKVTDVPEGGSKTESFTVKDADGDTTSFDITATQSKEDTSSDIVGLDGSGSQLTPGQDYNIAFILDTSGSMYDDANNDIKGTVTESGNIIEAGDEDTRLGQALEAIYDFVETTLFSHGNSELGGNVNILLTTFWGYSGEQGKWYSSSQINNENDGVDIVLSFKEGLSEVDLKADILDQLKALYDSQVKGDSDGSSLDGRDEGFHWGTCYGKGFSSAAEWFESLSGNGAINETFFMSDGAPTPQETGRDEAYLELEKAMGLKDENGNDIEDSSSKIHAIGVGNGVSKGTLDKYDSEGDATIITDSNIKDMFKPEAGDTSTTTFSSSVGITGAGDDVALGGMGIDILKATLESMLGYEVSDKNIIEYMQNHPEWILEQDLASSLKNDPDLLVTGSGDDLVYGQGGDDVLIGDGNADKLEAFAENLGMNAEQSQDYSSENLANAGDDAQGLVINLHDAAQAASVETLIKAATALESDTDGHDNLYGGSGDDLLLGLGGNDHLSGGSGNDILLGGSGDDYLSGGEGSDILLGGSGNDVIRMDMSDILVDGGMDVDGTDMDVLLIDNASLEAVKDKMEDGSIDNMEVVIAGDVSGTSMEEVLQNSGAQDAEGNWLVNQEGSSWTASESSQTIGGREFMEFTNEADNITILVEATKLDIC